MRLLIDTHALIWFCEGSPSLSAAARAAMEDEANERFVSHAVPWEMAIKQSLGKLHLQAEFDVIFPGVLEANGLQMLPASLEHYRGLVTLETQGGARSSLALGWLVDGPLARPSENTRRRGKLLALEVGARITSADQKCFEIPATEDEGLDMKLEFTNDNGEGMGRRLYQQLKSGNSHLTKRKTDGAEIFTIKKQRWVEYWLAQPHPVMLVIGTFSEDDERAIGKDKLEFAEVRWMEISSVLQRESQNGTKPVKQIEFKGERLDLSSVRRWRARVLALTPS